MRNRSTIGAAIAVGAVTLLTSGCLSSGGDGGGGSNNTSNEIELMYGFTGNQDQVFQSVMKEWAGQNDVTIQFSPTPDFNSLINTRVQGNQLPDIAIFPQPGILRTMAERGVLSDVSEAVDMDDLEANMLPGAIEAGQGEDGTQYGILMSSNIKSVVYYPKAGAEQAGLTTPPATFDDLLSLSKTVAATGTTPWCFGIENGPGTGWPATDWVENLMLINYGSDVYNQWVQHEIPFNDPRVLEVLNQMEELLLAPGETNGGREAIASNNFQTAGNPMFDTPPGCYMYRQGNFLTQQGFFPDAVVDTLDDTVGVFPMPGTSADSSPVLGGGDLAGLFSGDNESAQKTLAYMASVDFQNKMAKELTSYLAPRSDVDPANYPSDTSRNFATIQNEATDWAFDGSDQMPGAVGSGSFWKEMTAWIAGEIDAQTALDNIEASWPAS
ncbi:extracellular solute-binding protein [Modestobacter sp. I12A-02628]|uniref:Carbohydrate ABC transporter substrate-binding protein n=1 Tax=Goekera deserti TaxID=2497753 RepID=A0A7K3WB96_9ACTN|nr:ABC transporter substrate-binding protein [Goekera deserti]MPQ97415.1 extracellular solute-binding protein [Goekera deserti]NDI47984.1 extracellular solute-binding protein [Goekera deserti]NEL53732.1 carbohydrate ABC transporter substrate-binding protein [Goekera deserti]